VRDAGEEPASQPTSAIASSNADAAETKSCVVIATTYIGLVSRLEHEQIPMSALLRNGVCAAVCSAALIPRSSWAQRAINSA
jgi:hypothetical protein